jgi:hypothetical protein
MLVGINYPWIDYGWDFGDPPSAWVGSESLAEWRGRKRKKIEADFGRFASQGIFAVRWFLLADGLNYGTGQFAPREEAGSWTFDPLPYGDPFYDRLRNDFEYVLQACEKNGLKLFPSLMDFYWCRRGVPAKRDRGIVKGGRYDIIRDPAKRRDFFDRVLEPLLACSMSYRESIYAWELINEPEWAVRNFLPFARSRTVSKKEMQLFLAEGMHRVNRNRLPDGTGAFQSSIGFAHWKSMGNWNAEDLGITLHQFHYYAQRNRDLPIYSRLKVRPCVVGEFATAVEREWPALRSVKNKQTTADRLSCIEEKGYPACFLWSANAVDRATRWTEKEQQEVIAYTRNKPNKRQVT